MYRYIRFVRRYASDMKSTGCLSTIWHAAVLVVLALPVLVMYKLMLPKEEEWSSQDEITGC